MVDFTEAPLRVGVAALAVIAARPPRLLSETPSMNTVTACELRPSADLTTKVSLRLWLVKSFWILLFIASAR